MYQLASMPKEMHIAPDIGFDRRFDEHAEKGSDNGADAAGEHRTADNRRCDGIHFKAARLLDETARRVETKDESRKRGEESVEHIREELRFAHIDTHEQSRLFVAADRKKIA